MARRLARVNQIYGSQILLGPRTFSEARKDIVARPIDFLRSAAAHERLEVYELLALTENATAEEIIRRDRFWTAIVFFRERRWNEALAEFNRARGDNGELDEPLQWYLRRLEPVCLNMTTEPAIMDRAPSCETHGISWRDPRLDGQLHKCPASVPLGGANRALDGAGAQPATGGITRTPRGDPGAIHPACSAVFCD